MEEDDIDIFIRKQWMVMPCLLYKEEYSDCKSIKSRFHQRFVYGSFVDCSQWKRNFDNCVKWTEKHDKKALKDLVKTEEARKKERLDSHYGNDTWEKRAQPPSGWNDPLPTWIEERMKNSYLAMKANDIKGVTSERTFCVIS